MVLQKLSKDQIREHLKQRWTKGGTCNVCGANAWNVLDEEYRLPSRDDSTDLLVVAVMCEDCGAVMFFSADVIRNS